MNKSEVVEKLKERYKDTNIKLYTEEEPRKIGQPDEVLTTKAYKQICDMWNVNEKSRGFVKYLIQNFLPIDQFSKVFNYSEEDIKNDKNRCCILRIKLGNIGDMADYFAKVGMSRLRGAVKAQEEGRTRLPKKEYEEIKKLQRETPIEIKNGTVGYLSKDGEKYLSGEALVALQLFVQEALLDGDKEIEFVIRKHMLRDGQKHVKKEKRLNDTQLNQVTARTVYGARTFMSDETIDKLQELKKELEKKNKEGN